MHFLSKNCWYLFHGVIHDWPLCFCNLHWWHSNLRKSYSTRHISKKWFVHMFCAMVCLFIFLIAPLHLWGRQILKSIFDREDRSIDRIDLVEWSNKSIFFYIWKCLYCVGKKEILKLFKTLPLLKRCRLIDL